MEKSKTRTIQALLLAFILGAFAFWMDPAVAAEKKMVKDPSTGKMVTAPEYGGTISFVYKTEPAGPDVYVSGGQGSVYVAGVLEKLAIPDWATPRDEITFSYPFSPSNMKGALAESWSQPDPLTYIFNIRQGIRWHDKPPMSGRELTADDIEYNFHRLLGVGSGFTEPINHPNTFGGMQFESVTATNRYTVVFKMKEQNLGALYAIMDNYSSWIYPPEVIKEHGDVTDWRNLVGTGPYMLTDWVEGSSQSYTKNPDYWGYDEKYPENRLPYIEKLERLFIQEEATRLAGLRAGKIDFVEADITSVDVVDSLQKTNPEIVLHSMFGSSQTSYGLDATKPPFDDIRVRKAMQMALDLEGIDRDFYKGTSEWQPQGIIGKGVPGYFTPFEEWPEEVKKVYTYDPAGAETLLDEAGYPRGADGTRFKTVLNHLHRFPFDYTELAATYWAEIGVDVEINVLDEASAGPTRRDRTWEGLIYHAMGVSTAPLSFIRIFAYSTSFDNLHGIGYPELDALVDAAVATTSIEEQQRLVKEIDMYMIENHWYVWGPMTGVYRAVQPWVTGFNGEWMISYMDQQSIHARLWIDSALKAEMGH